MIEKRRPHFQRMRHAHPVGFIQNVVRQIVALIDQKIPVEKPAAVVQRERVDQFRQSASVQYRADSLALLSRKSAVPEEMRLIGIESAPFQPAFDLVLEADLLIRNRPVPVERVMDQLPCRPWQPPERPRRPVCKVRQISAEQLVRAFSRKRDRHMLAAQTRQVPYWKRSGVRARLIRKKCEVFDRVPQVRLRAQVEFVVIGSVYLRDLPEVPAFVKTPARKRNRKRLQLSRCLGR